MASSPEQRCVFTLCADEPLTAGLREVCGLGHAEPPQPSANASSEGKRVLEWDMCYICVYNSSYHWQMLARGRLRCQTRCAARPVSVPLRVERSRYDYEEFITVLTQYIWSAPIMGSEIWFFWFWESTGGCPRKQVMWHTQVCLRVQVHLKNLEYLERGQYLVTHFRKWNPNIIWIHYT